MGSNVNRRRWIRRLLLVVAIGLALVGCGSSASDDSSSPLTEAQVAEQPAGSADEGTAATVAPDLGVVTVLGEPLTPYDGDPIDVAGSTAPVVIGHDLLTSTEVRVETDGKPMVVGFYAHWCPHCQREVDELTAWLETNDLPDTVDFYAISTFFDSGRDNYPPAAWFEREGWALPVVSDTESYEVAGAFGVPSIPFYVFVNADGTISSRFGGNIGPDELVQIMDELTDGP